MIFFRLLLYTTHSSNTHKRQIYIVLLKLCFSGGLSSHNIGCGNEYMIDMLRRDQNMDQVGHDALLKMARACLARMLSPLLSLQICANKDSFLR